MIVLDASLAVKLVIQEVDSDAADNWYYSTGDDIAAPDRITIEVAQAIVRRVNARKDALATGRNALRTWHAILEGGAITLLRSDPKQVNTAAELAMQIGHPVKDCVYLALAMEHSCDLATCDARFVAKARPLYPAVRLLADYAS